MSGWSWESVIARLPRYHCLVPDLPQYGQSVEEGPFEMGRAAAVVAEIIRSRVGTGRAHLVGFSLGAQVALQLMATEPEVIDRAVLCGPAINAMPAARAVQFVLGQLARTPPFQWAIKRHWKTRETWIPSAKIGHYREDQRLMTHSKLAHIVSESAGFTVPPGLGNSNSPTLIVTGGNELPFTRQWAALLAQSMPNGVNRIATGMRHDWPLRCPDLFSRTVDGWISQTAIPPEVRHV